MSLSRRLVTGPRAAGVLGLSLVMFGCAPETTSPVPTVESVRAALRRGSYDEAEEGARRLLEKSDSVPSGTLDSLTRAERIDLLVESLWRAGRAREADTSKLAVEAVQIKEERLSAADPRLVPSLLNLGIVQRRNGDAESAEATLLRALAMLGHDDGAEERATAPLLTQIGILRLSEGKSDEARSHLERAVSIFERYDGSDSPALADPLRALGVLHRRMGHYDVAAAIYERLLSIEQRHLVAESPDRARSLNSYAALLQNLGDFAGARLRFEQALEIRRKTLPTDHPDIGANLNNLAIVLGDIGDHAAASRHYAEALAILEKELGEDHPYVADVLNNYADSLRKIGELPRARELFERALQIREDLVGEVHPDVAQSLTNLALLLTDTGEYEAAQGLYERALPIWKETLGPEHLEVSECLTALGKLLTRKGEPAAARPLFREALAIRESTGGPDHPLVAETLVEAARAARDEGDRREALDLAMRAHATQREHVRLTSQTLAEREALGYGESRLPALDIALSLAASPDATAETVRRVWDGVIRSRGFLFDEIAFRGRELEETGDPELARRVEALRAARARLAELWVRGGGELEPNEYRARLDRAHRDKEQAEISLARSSVEFRRRREREALGFDEVRAALPQGVALVAYSRGASADFREYVVFVLPASNRAPLALPLGDAEEVEHAIDAWRESVRRGGEARGRASAEAESEYRQTARRLRSLVWDPVAAHLEGAQRVVLVADGALNLISYSALPLDGEGYLIERPPSIRNAVTERDLLSVEDASRGAASGLLALGGADYEKADGLPERPSSNCGDPGSLVFEPLPETEREVRELASKWEERSPSGPARVLTGKQASEADFKRLAPGKRVLHLATHGFFLGGDCAEQTGAAGVASQNPLLLSGLALAGANRRAQGGPGEEDGILTAEEIASMRLDGTEWVVLSACDTALGRVYAGEDVFGLRRAFQLAGAERVVMSLWQVDDLAGRRFMTAFYDAAFAGSGSAGPDRLAGLKILQERRRAGRSTHPYYWAAFVASGS